jgi:hypothetical protein
MQKIIYLYGKIDGVIHPTVFLLGRSTHPREGERGRGNSPEEEAMEEGGLRASILVKVRPNGRFPSFSTVVFLFPVR